MRRGGGRVVGWVVPAGILSVGVNVRDVLVNIQVAFVDLVELEFEVLIDKFVAVEQLVQPGDGAFLIITVIIHY